MEIILLFIAGIVIIYFIITIVNGISGQSNSDKLGDSDKLSEVRGEVILSGIYYKEKVNIVLYSDKIVINNLEIITLERVIRANSYSYSKPLHSRTTVSRLHHHLQIYFTDLYGREKTVSCYSCRKFWFTGVYEEFAKKINKLVCYTPPSKPKEPYEI